VAGAAPFRPEIHHDGLSFARRQHLDFKISVVYRKNVFSHNVSMSSMGRLKAAAVLG